MRIDGGPDDSVNTVATWRAALTVTGGYAATATCLGWISPSPVSLGALWPSGGLLLAMLMLTEARWRVRMALLLGGAHAAAGILVAGEPTAAALFGAIVAVQAWATVAQWERWNGRMPRFDSLTDLQELIWRGCLMAAGCAGAAAGLVAWGAFDASFLIAWRDWWLRESTGMLILTPLVVVGASAPRRAILVSRRLAEGIALAVCLTMSTGYIFNAASPRVPLSVGVTPFLVWAALRFGVFGTSAASLLLWAVAGEATRVGTGPLRNAAITAADQLARMHMYVAVTAGLVLVVAVAIAERRVVAARLVHSIDELRDAFTRSQAVIASAPENIAALTTDYRLSGFNTAWAKEYERLAGVPPLSGLDLGQQLAAIGTPWALVALDGWRRALGGEQFAVRRGPDVLGAPRELSVEYSPIRDDDGRLIGAMQLVRDVTEERRRFEAQGQTRRLESVGRLAGGVAHEFNNILTGILSYTALLQQATPEDDPRRKDLRAIEAGAERAAELTAQLLAYARRQFVAPRVVDINAQIEAADRLLRPLVGAQLVVERSLAPSPWPVRIDPAALEQALISLAMNAIDAMPDGGVLHFATSNVSVDDETLSQSASGPGDYIRVDVGDTGRGISPEHLEHMFEPFFSTKGVGLGTGLGLASVFGIVQQAGGAISVESAVGVGTTFRIHLPRATSE
ncbi:MAG: MASE1 domain-containing protein [Gemmatimonadota bacterium]|nr:MASE1 domain-containing protein [Gemmatimonadota bacterium]